MKISIKQFSSVKLIFEYSHFHSIPVAQLWLCDRYMCKYIYYNFKKNIYLIRVVAESMSGLSIIRIKNRFCYDFVARNRLGFAIIRKQTTPMFESAVFCLFTCSSNILD